MKPVNFVVLFAPLVLALADVVDSAPAGAAGIARDVSAHRRGLVDVPSSPWHRRYPDNARRQVVPAAADPEPPTGPPAVVVVPTNDSTTTSSTTDTTSSSSSTSSSSTSESSSASTSDSTSTSTSSESSSSSSSTSSSSTSSDSSSSSSSSFTPAQDSSSSTETTSSSSETPIITPIITLPSISLSITLPTDSLTLPTSLPTDPGTLLPTEPTSTSETNTSTGTEPGTSPGTGGPTEPTSTAGPTEPPTSTSTPIFTPPTSSSSSTPVLNITDVFPTDGSSDITPSVTITETSSSRAPLTIDSQFQFLTASSFIIDTSSRTSTSVSLTNPDEALTTPTLSPGSATTLVIPAIPSSLPLFITPPQSADPLASGLNLPGYTEISILFQLSVRWTWVLESSETAAQIIAYMPQIIKYALDSSSDVVRTIGLSAYQTTSYQGPDDLMTLWQGYLKTELVQELAAMVKVGTSDFYQVPDPVAKAIAKTVVGSYDIATTNGVSNTNGSSNPSSSTTQVDNSRRNAIIGVCVAFGLIALIVIAWWIMRTYKARKEGMHKRLSYEGQTNYGAAGHGVAAGGYSATGMRPDSPPNMNNPFMTEREREEEARGIRRNSFYAIGPDDASLEEETFDYMSQRSSGGLNRAHSGGHSGWANSNTLTVPGGNSASRRPVVGQPISQPILRESSMGNW